MNNVIHNNIKVTAFFSIIILLIIIINLLQKRKRKQLSQGDIANLNKNLNKFHEEYTTENRTRLVAGNKDILRNSKIKNTLIIVLIIPVILATIVESYIVYNFIDMNRSVTLYITYGGIGLAITSFIVIIYDRKVTKYIDEIILKVKCL